ncbi:MAG: glycosyltransferase family 39 protein, partial [Tepidisphaeraceae bacterium]
VRQLRAPMALEEIPLRPRLLPQLDVPYEPLWKRWLFVAVAVAIVGGFFYFNACYNATANPGINQNAYLTGGKMIADHGSTGFLPAQPYQFIGWMWVRTPEGWYYPKYPIGIPLINAALLAINWDQGKLWAFWVSPVAMSLAMLGAFMLFRIAAGSFAALLGMMVLMTSQVTLAYTDNPLSHGPGMFTVIWGMYFLIRFWQSGAVWRGALAGFLLGYAVMIRYTEGLLVLPVAAVLLCMMRYHTAAGVWWRLIVWLAVGAAALVAHFGYDVEFNWWKTPAIVLGTLLVTNPWQRDWRAMLKSARWARPLIAAVLLVCVMKLQLAPKLEDEVQITICVFVKLAAMALIALLYLLRWDQPRTWLPSAAVTLAWMFPVCVLVGFNLVAMRSITGYDATNESTGFTWAGFVDKWDYMLQQVYDYGLFMIVPLALVGTIMMFRWSWRMALLMCLWLVPGIVLYNAYYFGKQRPGMWYLRFFMTLFPPMLFAGMWLLRNALMGTSPGVGRGRGSVAGPVAMGALVALSAGMGLSISVPSMEHEFYANTNLAYTISRIWEKIPTTVDGKRITPVVFADRAPLNSLNNLLSFSGDFELYASDAFSARGPQWSGGDPNPDAPNPLQAARRAYMAGIFRGKTEADLIKEQNRIMSQALDSGRTVYAILQPNFVPLFKSKYVTREFEMVLVDKWREPLVVPLEKQGGPLSPNSRGFNFSPNRNAQPWQIHQIRRKPPAAQPTTEPTTQPTTQPSSKAV